MKLLPSEANTGDNTVMASRPPNPREADRVVIIRRIALDPGGRLRVYPSGDGDYSYIWRDASSVRWDSEDHSLYVLPVKYFTLADDLNQIIKAVRGECGTQLVTDTTTVFDVPPEMTPQLRKVLKTTFTQLNHGWNAEPNAPEPKAEWRGNDLCLTFRLNAFQFPKYQEGDMGEIIFFDCSRYRFGTLNDEGWYRKQGRFCDVMHQWGEFYRVEGDLRLDRLPDDWKTRDPSATDRQHFLFYFRDEDFECDARDWELKVVKVMP